MVLKWVVFSLKPFCKRILFSFSFELFSPKSDLYKTASKPSKYTFKKSFNQDGAKFNKDTVKSQSAQFSSDWEPEDVEKVITEELREIQETLMVSLVENIECSF